MRTARQTGPFIRHCPCSPDTVSCGYYNIDLLQGCPFDCSYCILQAYLQDPEPLLFDNLDDLRSELEGYRDQAYMRLGTGELADSLAFDPRTGQSLHILQLFKDFPGMVFEFKTKSTAVDHLLNVSTVPRNVVVSWSLNPDPLCRREEHGAPELSARLNAMAAVAERGYRVGIHFDPMIAVPAWKAWYPALVDEILDRIPENRLAWWSLGTLRFPPSLREIILSRSGSCLFSGELIRGYDGKYRYFRPLRRQMYRTVLDGIRRRVSDAVPVYLCMEDHRMWADVFPGETVTEAGINEALHRAAMR
ncbi:MAG: hypothetical protein JXA62_07470 [Candidatus Aminicenantes bacterium]|nr:hypothetical protein [Candidatus Aminicenantes bacterium]